VTNIGHIQKRRLPSNQEAHLETLSCPACSRLNDKWSPVKSDCVGLCNRTQWPYVWPGVWINSNASSPSGNRHGPSPFNFISHLLHAFQHIMLYVLLELEYLYSVGLEALVCPERGLQGRTKGIVKVALSQQSTTHSVPCRLLHSDS
jgi:hypothetical protein